MNSYEYDDRISFIKIIKNELNTNNIVLIRKFPIDLNTLLEFNRNFGKPVAKITATDDSLMSFIGDIRFRADIEESERMPTQGDGFVSIHTGRSYAVNRTKVFAMLKANKGTSKGESLFLDWDDFILDYIEMNPILAKADLNSLMTTPVCNIHPSYLKHYAENNIEVSNEPLISRSGTGYNVRYWVGMKEWIDNNKCQLHSNFIAALTRFNCALLATPLIKVVDMDEGDLVIMNNAKIGHGRLPFTSPTSGDNDTFSKRQIYNVHLI